MRRCHEVIVLQLAIAHMRDFPSLSCRIKSQSVEFEPPGFHSLAQLTWTMGQDNRRARLSREDGVRMSRNTRTNLQSVE